MSFFNLIIALLEKLGLCDSKTSKMKKNLKAMFQRCVINLNDDKQKLAKIEKDIALLEENISSLKERHPTQTEEVYASTVKKNELEQKAREIRNEMYVYNMVISKLKEHYSGPGPHDDEDKPDDLRDVFQEIIYSELKNKNMDREIEALGTIQYTPPSDDQSNTDTNSNDASLIEMKFDLSDAPLRWKQYEGGDTNAIIRPADKRSGQSD